MLCKNGWSWLHPFRSKCVLHSQSTLTFLFLWCVVSWGTKRELLPRPWSRLPWEVLKISAFLSKRDCPSNPPQKRKTFLESSNFENNLEDNEKKKRKIFSCFFNPVKKLCYKRRPDVCHLYWCEDPEFWRALPEGWFKPTNRRKVVVCLQLLLIEGTPHGEDWHRVDKG